MIHLKDYNQISISTFLILYFQMVHIGLGVYIHSDQYFEVIRKKNDGQAMVRILMNFFFSKDQMKGGTLSERGCGRMLDPLLTKAIVSK